MNRLLCFMLIILATMPVGVLAAAGAGGVPMAPAPVFKGWGVVVTNSMLMMWIVALLGIVGIRLLTGVPRLVPSRGQALVEELLCSLRDLLAPIVGKRLAKPTFPLLLSFFIYILLMNWSGLLPGVGNIGVWEGVGADRRLADFFRPANSDLNTTLALAFVSFGGWVYFVLRFAGLRGLAKEMFGNKASRSEVSAPVYLFLTALFLAVGVIEVISILFRPVSLSFRLYGNIFGGENLLHHLGALAPYILPAAAYFLETLVGLIQALVFTLLSAVYIGLVCNHEQEEHAP